ncbi:unnamed protein product [Urochloa humidicola]
MPDDEELEATRRLASHALAELSRHDVYSSTSPPCADVLALLRCCFHLLSRLNAGDPTLAARYCHGLLDFLSAILSRDPSPSILSYLEVFAESLVFGDRLRSCLAMADYAAPEGSTIFTKAMPCQGDYHLVLELLCHHFISSFEDEGGFEVFWSALSWSGIESRVTPGISFHGTLVLIRRTSWFSLPAVVEAHLLLLASRCISDQDLDLDLHLLEHAMNLYVRYLPALHVFKRTGGVKTPWNCLGKEMPLSCCIKDATNQKLRSQINGLLSFCQLHSDDDLPTDEGDIDRLIEENQHILHEKLRQEYSMVLKDLLLKILFRAKQKEVLESDTSVLDGIICLAAVLRVMSSSLLQILHCSSRMASASDKENVNYATLGYNLIYESIRLLGQHEANELQRYDLLDIIGMPVDRESAPMLMLAHFATLSLCCVRKRLGFLWKGCIVMVIMSMNLIAEEEGPGTFQPSSKERAIICYTEERGVLEVSPRIKAMALQYETIHETIKRRVDGDGSRLSVRKSDGQAYLECLPGYSREGWDDMMDFVECEEGKDYSYTLKQHRKSWKFRYEKWRSQGQSNVASTLDISGLKRRRLCC